MTITLTILGCGSSAGVPRPALGWGACDPNNPRNRRRRCSLLVERAGAHGTTRIVIDTSPDLREQLIDANVDHIDAVFLTHEHADQTHGIDDLRSVVLHQRRRIPVYFNMSTAKDIMARFSIASSRPKAATIRRSDAAFHRSRPEHTTTEGGRSSSRPSGPTRPDSALGYRVRNAAYTPDLHDIPRRELAAPENLDL
jgi:phosphoribosyl 1,2-cyclic phosphate phosphodiesterase